MSALGLDFGTTNSALARAEDSGAVDLATFPHGDLAKDTFRSILHFHPDRRDRRGRPVPIGGHRAIDAYLAAEGAGRLMQSMKSYLADRGFDSTVVFEKTFSLEELLAALLGALREQAELRFGPLGRRVVCGRPVRFMHAESDDDDALAEARLRRALERAGFDEVTFEFEPVGAAYYYESRLDHDEVVLVADFGGGTSDFSLVEVGPTARRRGRRTILGNDGVALAGDALDGKIMHHVVAPALGLGTTYKSMFDQVLPVPVWLYAKLRRWHHVSLLKAKKTIELLEEIADRSESPERIRFFLHILEWDLGFRLAGAVEQAKVSLSGADAAELVFEDAPFRLATSIRRGDFETWIADETCAIDRCVERLLATAGLSAKEVDRVFMTGGTSRVPAVRAVFSARFGDAKLAGGGELVSVASGLALRALEA
jgi:hypothetical chaperone protein